MSETLSQGFARLFREEKEKTAILEAKVERYEEALRNLRVNIDTDGDLIWSTARGLLSVIDDALERKE